MTSLWRTKEYTPILPSSNLLKMPSTGRQRLKEGLALNVIRAVKLLEKECRKGVSRQNIEKYFQQQLSRQVVKSAIREALHSGLLVHATGVGLNGSFVIAPSNKNIRTARPRKPKKFGARENAKLGGINLPSSDLEEQVTPTLQREKATNPLDSNKHQQNTKLTESVAETSNNDKLEGKVKSKTFKAILKTQRRPKIVSKVVKSRKVKFSSPPNIILISPRITRKSEPKRLSFAWNMRYGIYSIKEFKADHPTNYAGEYLASQACDAAVKPGSQLPLGSLASSARCA